MQFSKTNSCGLYHINRRNGWVQLIKWSCQLNFLALQLDPSLTLWNEIALKKFYVLVSAVLSLQSPKLCKLRDTISLHLQTWNIRKLSFFKSNLPSHKSWHLSKAGLWRFGFKLLNMLIRFLNQNCLGLKEKNCRLCLNFLQNHTCMPENITEL